MAIKSNLGMGELDSKQAKEYYERQKDKESDENIDRDIEGQRSKQPLFRTKSYSDINKENEKDYSNLSESNNRINSIPNRYKEYR